MQMNQIKIATFCFNYETSVKKNKTKISKMLEKTKNNDFVLLPEDSFDADGKYFEEIPGEITCWLQDKSKQFSVNIIGNLTEKSQENYFNTCLIIDKTGDLVGTYRKIQLSHTDRTLRGLGSGKKLPLFELDGIPFGISICYDIWYPELIRNLVFKGAKIIFSPFKEENEYIPYVRSLVSARAIENIIPLVCCGGGGTSEKFKCRYQNFAFYLLPSGKIIKEETEEEFSEYAFSNIDTLIEREKAQKSWKRPFDVTKNLKEI